MAWNSSMDCQGAQSQKEGQEHEYQGEIKELGGDPPCLFKVSWSSFWLWALWQSIFANSGSGFSLGFGLSGSLPPSGCRLSGFWLSGSGFCHPKP